MSEFRGKKSWIANTVELIQGWSHANAISLPVDDNNIYEVKLWFYRVTGVDRLSIGSKVKAMYEKFESGEIPIEAFHGPHGLAVFKAWMIRNAANKN